jgi:hypothetical protein
MTDWDARDYAAHSAAQQEWVRELIAKRLPKGSVLASTSRRA